ncbi:MAG TPA: hypothetical protein DEV93_11235 [Chloroflexi bacterium]|jgi:hypothetical protein|nr:hypothetical protein [Chloroflexota bacterium]
MTIVTKDADIAPAGPDDAFPGSFEVILSAPTKDRDGDTLLPDEWKMPLPEHITFDVDHGMSVEKTIGSGVPSIDPETGNLIVKGTYSSLPRAQDVRTLVNEGHIRTTSVAFMTEKTQKDGATVTQRELLNGAMVAIPSNREAKILSSKSLAAKAGARNSAADAAKVQGIHDDAAALGADCAAPAKSFTRKDADTEDATDPVALISAVDAAIDEAIDLFSAADLTSLPAEVQQAIALVQAADATVDELLDALGIPDPDEDAAASGADQAPAAGAPVAPAAGVRSAPVADADSDAVTVKSLEELTLQIQAAQFI